MKRLLFACAAIVALSSAATEVSAQSPAPYAHGSLGFFNPYSFPASGSVRTPPYFSVHPPVYYSTRHARPYGMSPFAAPPMVTPGANYRGRQAAEFTPKTTQPSSCSHCGGTIEAHPHVPSEPAGFAIGEIQRNPFATSTQLAESRAGHDE